MNAAQKHIEAIATRRRWSYAWVRKAQIMVTAMSPPGAQCRWNYEAAVGHTPSIARCDNLWLARLQCRFELL